MHTSWLSPFRERSFRFQWPAALLTVWAMEMETLVLGWYVLVATGSVQMLTFFAASLYVGTLIAPMLGVVADRLGHRTTLVLMRLWYTGLATTLMAFAFADLLAPTVVIAIAFLNGLIRPSDLAIRSAFIAGSLPPDLLSPAMALERTTIDSARIAGALVGASLFATLGLPKTYVAIAAVYLIGASLTFIAGSSARRGLKPSATPVVTVVATPASFWRELRDGIAFVRGQPVLRGAMWMALLANLTGFPLTNGLLPYAAREVFAVDEHGLSYLVACFASGALVGSISFRAFTRRIPLARLMLISAAAWYALLAVFGQMTVLPAAMFFLFLGGLAQSLCMIALVVLILRTTTAELTGRVMGVRILAIYGLPVGLLIAGWLIARIGFAATITAYMLCGFALVIAIALRFHGDLWRVEAPANST